MSHIIRVIRFKDVDVDGTFGKYGQKKSACSVLVGKRDGKRPLVRSRLRRQGNIKLDRQETRQESKDCINLALKGTSERLLRTT